MPALRALGRRWFIGTDDLPFLAVLWLPFHLVWLFFLPIWLADLAVSNCSESQTKFFIYGGVMLALHALETLAHTSALVVGTRGSMFEPRKRRGLVKLEELIFIRLGLAIALLVYGFIIAYSGPSACQDSRLLHEQTLLQAMVWSQLAKVAANVAVLSLVFNSFPNLDDPRTWERRCTCFARCLCCFKLRINSNQDDGDTLRRLAHVMTKMFGHIDMTPTDIAAAFYVSAKLQQWERQRAFAAMFGTVPGDSGFGVESCASSPCVDPHLDVEQASQTVFFASTILVPVTLNDSDDGNRGAKAPHGGGVPAVRTGRSFGRRRSRNASTGNVPRTASQLPSLAEAEADAAASTAGDGAALGCETTEPDMDESEGSVAAKGPLPEAAGCCGVAHAGAGGDLGATGKGEGVEGRKESEIEPEASNALAMSAGSRSSNKWLTPITRQLGHSASAALRSMGHELVDLPTLATATHYMKYAFAAYGYRLYVVATFGVVGSPLRLFWPSSRRMKRDVVRPLQRSQHERAAPSKPGVARNSSAAEVQGAASGSSNGGGSTFSTARAWASGGSGSGTPRRRPAWATPVLPEKRLTLNAILLAAGPSRGVSMSLDDLLYVRYDGECPLVLPWFLARDAPMRTLVLSIRGTMTIDDVITDVLYMPARLDEWISSGIEQDSKWTPPPLTLIDREAKLAAHSGMMEAARATMQDIQENGQLQRVMVEGDGGQPGLLEQGWQLVVTGHSLGAGVAALVALHLRQWIPNVRCWAFSPPGGTMSPAASELTKPFVTSVAVGKDLVPRLNSATVARVFQQMVEAGARCRVSKARLVSHALFSRKSWTESSLLLPEDAISDEARELLQSFRCSRRAVEEEEVEACCAQFCAPGRLVFLRPMPLKQGLRARAALRERFTPVWVEPEELISEGVLYSRRCWPDHLPWYVLAALRVVTAAAAGQMEEADVGEVQRQADAVGKVETTDSGAASRQMDLQQLAGSLALKYRWQQPGGGEDASASRGGHLGSASNGMAVTGCSGSEMGNAAEVTGGHKERARSGCAEVPRPAGAEQSNTGCSCLGPQGGQSARAGSGAP